MSMSFLSLSLSPWFSPMAPQLTHANPEIAPIPFALVAISQSANCSQTNLGVFVEKSCTVLKKKPRRVIGFLRPPDKAQRRTWCHKGHYITDTSRWLRQPESGDGPTYWECLVFVLLQSFFFPLQPVNRRLKKIKILQICEVLFFFGWLIVI